MRKILIASSILVGLALMYVGYIAYDTRALFNVGDPVLMSTTSDSFAKIEFACQVNPKQAFAKVVESRVVKVAPFEYMRLYKVETVLAVNSQYAAAETVVPGFELAKAEELDEIICVAMLNVPPR